MKIRLHSVPLEYVEYDPDRRVLEVGFRKGTTYSYSGVPVWVFDALLDADSKGRYFIEHIRNNYPYWRGDAQLPA
jgi:hypothetical protein